LSRPVARSFTRSTDAVPAAMRRSPAARKRRVEAPDGWRREEMEWRELGEFFCVRETASFIGSGKAARATKCERGERIASHEAHFTSTLPGYCSKSSSPTTLSLHSKLSFEKSFEWFFFVFIFFNNFLYIEYFPVP
jgi:hypothetical protein